MDVSKLIIIFFGRFPSEKAASLFVAKNAESFTREKQDVTLLVPRRRKQIKKDPFTYYDLHQRFNIIYLPTIDMFGKPIIGRFAFMIGMASFCFSIVIYVLKYSGKKVLFYSNENIPLYILSFIREYTFYEMHDFPEKKISKFFYSFFLPRMRWVLIHNKWKLDKAQKSFVLLREKLLMQPNAVDLKEFAIDMKRKDARNILNLPLEAQIVVYTGHLYAWKGVHTLALTTQYLDKNTHIYFVGGTQMDITLFKAQYGNNPRVHIMGYREHGEMKVWQKAADVLVIPNTAKEKISKYYTSPMKLFEYMASNRPIVATDIPSIREIVDETTAFICKPDDPKNMARSIVRALYNKEESVQKSENALQKVHEYTWTKRAQNILKFANIASI